VCCASSRSMQDNTGIGALCFQHQPSLPVRVGMPCTHRRVARKSTCPSAEFGRRSPSCPEAVDGDVLIGGHLRPGAGKAAGADLCTPHGGWVVTQSATTRGSDPLESALPAGRWRSEGVSGFPESLILHNPGVSLGFGGKAGGRLRQGADPGHLHGEVVIASSDYAIIRIGHGCPKCL